MLEQIRTDNTPDIALMHWCKLLSFILHIHIASLDTWTDTMYRADTTHKATMTVAMMKEKNGYYTCYMFNTYYIWDSIQIKMLCHTDVIPDTLW